MSFLVFTKNISFKFFFSKFFYDQSYILQLVFGKLQQQLFKVVLTQLQKMFGYF